jgi:hypothetical protein
MGAVRAGIAGSLSERENHTGMVRPRTGPRFSAQLKPPRGPQSLLNQPDGNSSGGGDRIAGRHIEAMRDAVGLHVHGISGIESQERDHQE